MSEDKRKSRNLIEGILIYAIGNFGSKILVFLIVPLYTYYITTSEMGNYDLLMTTVNLLTPIVTMQISDAAFRWMIRESEGIDIYVRSTIQVLFANCCITAIAIYIVGLVFPFQYCSYFILVLVTSRALATVQKLLRGLKNQKLFAISGIVYTVIFLALNIIQICILKKGVVSLFQSSIIANVLSLALIFSLERRLRIQFIRKPDLITIRKLLRFSIPLVPNQLNWWVINSSDRYIIKFFLGAAANGIYAIAYKFPTMLQVVLSLFTTSWQDVAVADMDSDASKFYSMVFKKLYLFSFSFLWFLNPVTKVFIHWFMNSSYHDASKYVSFLYLGTVFQSFASFYGVGYLRDKRTSQATATSIYGALINAGVNIALIKVIGLQAASISTFLGFAVMWLIREHQNKKELGVKIEWIEFGILFAITLIFSIYECVSPINIDIILGVCGFVAFIFINRQMIISMIKRK